MKPTTAFIKSKDGNAVYFMAEELRRQGYTHKRPIRRRWWLFGPWTASMEKPANDDILPLDVEPILKMMAEQGRDVYDAGPPKCRLCGHLAPIHHSRCPELLGQPQPPHHP